MIRSKRISGYIYTNHFLLESKLGLRRIFLNVRNEYSCILRSITSEIEKRKLTFNITVSCLRKLVEFSLNACDHLSPGETEAVHAGSKDQSFRNIALNAYLGCSDDEIIKGLVRAVLIPVCENIQNSIFSVGSVSPDEDKQVYNLIKKYS